jgi:hypothetical protein
MATPGFAHLEWDLAQDDGAWGGGALCGRGKRRDEEEEEENAKTICATRNGAEAFALSCAIDHLCAPAMRSRFML